MAGTGKKATTNPPRFRLGDRVKFPFTLYTAHGVITEDRGGLGIEGERLYGVHFVLSPGEDQRYLEVDEGDLQPDDNAVSENR